MEHKYRNKEIDMAQKEPVMLKNISESFLANLPILVCGLAVALVLIREIIV